MSLIHHEDFKDTMPTVPIPFDARRHTPDPRPKWGARLLIIAICAVAGCVMLALSF